MSQLIRNYRDLLVWQRGMDLIDKTDDIVRRFSSSDRFWLGSQMLRAALSIPSNIAEGHDADYRPLCIRRLLTRRARARNWKLNYLWSNAAAQQSG